MFHAHVGRISMFAVGSLLVAAAGSPAASAEPATSGTSDVTVSAPNLQGWAFQAYDDVNYLDSNQRFVVGPGTPPLGGGSLKMSLSATDNLERVELFRTEQYDGTLVRDLRTMTYSTYTRANAGNTTPQQPTYLRLSVDTDGDGGTDDSLYFYPANNGAPVQNTWQTWDAGTGVWGVNGDQGPQSVTLATYALTHPDATIVKNEDPSDLDQVDGGVAFMVGGGGATQMNGEYFIDAITISKVEAATGSVSGKRFDLEPPQPKVSVGDAQVSEGNNGAALRFPVTVVQPTSKAVTLEYNTLRGTALPDSDYKAALGKVTIGAGQTTGEIVVQVVSDTVHEPTESMSVVVRSPGYGTVSDGTATGTILDDDAVALPPPVVTPPVTVAVQADLVVKGFGHQAGKDAIVANAIRKAAGAKVKLLRKTSAGKFRTIASGVLNSKGNHRFKNIADKNGTMPTTYKVKISRTDLTKRDKGRVSLR